MIAGYELDVESPYGIPTQAEKQKKPEPIKYPKTKIKWNHFGAKFEKLYNKAIAETDPEKRLDIFKCWLYLCESLTPIGI